MTTKTDTPADPFAGFVTETYNDGELVKDPADEPRDVPDYPSDDADEDEDEEGDEEGDEEPEEPKKKGKKNSISRRIGEYRRREAEARQRAEAAEAELARVRAGNPPTDAPKKDAPKVEPDLTDLKKPDPKDFEFGELDDGYQEALTDYRVEVKLRTKEAEQAAARQAEADAQTAQELQAEWEAQCAAAAERYDDFHEKVVLGADPKAPKWACSAVMADLLRSSPYGADVAYKLASDPAESKRVARLSPQAQAAWFGRVEAKIEAQAENEDEAPAQAGGAKEAQQRAPKATPPPKKKVRGAGGKFKARPDTTDFSAFERMAQGKG